MRMVADVTAAVAALGMAATSVAAGGHGSAERYAVTLLLAVAMGGQNAVPPATFGCRT
jgi:hypothetical protein